MNNAPELECSMLYSVLKRAFSHILSSNMVISLHPPTQGPFVHVASLCAALLSKFMAALFGGIFMVRMVRTIRFPDILMQKFNLVWAIEPSLSTECTLLEIKSFLFIFNYHYFVLVHDELWWKTQNCIFTVVTLKYLEILITFVRSYLSCWHCTRATNSQIKHHITECSFKRIVHRTFCFISLRGSLGPFDSVEV